MALALELNLHIKTDPKLHLGESEEMQSILCKDARNRERTWYFCECRALVESSTNLTVFTKGLLMDQSLYEDFGWV